MIKCIISLVCLAALLATVVYLILLIFGRRRLYKDYKHDYERLKMMVNSALITRSNYRNIKKKFEDIYKYSCREDEQLAQLLFDFHTRFRIFRPKR
jgi:hypothetical protein